MLFNLTNNILIDIHTHKKTSRTNELSIYNIFSSQIDINLLKSEEPLNHNAHNFFSIGLHPWHIQQDFAIQLQNLKNIIHYRTFIAIGETGLDKIYSTDFNEQKKIFIEQIKLSEEYKKPLIIHCVKAYNELITIHNNIKPSMPWIIHRFSGNLKTATQLINSNCYISFGEAVFKNPSAINLVKQLPIENLFLETDDANILISQVYNIAAEIKNISMDQLKTQLVKNFNRCFN